MIALLVLAAALPPFTRQTLPNGAVVYFVPRKDVPLVTFRAVIKGGAESDPAELGGLSSLTAELLRRGTATRTADQFSEQLDFLGAVYQSTTNAQATTLSVESLSKDAGRALDLLADAIVRPAFPESEVKKALAERINAAKAVKDQPSQAVGLYFHSFLFGPNHPYGHAPRGDEVSLARLERRHLTDYHSRIYVGANLILIAAGDFDPAALAPQIAKAFSGLPPGKTLTWILDKPPAPPAKARLLLIDKPDATQTYFWIGQAGLPRTHPDRVSVWLVNTLFGDRFTSMLNDELRVNTGLTYGARSVVEQNRLTGALAITTYTRTATTTKAIDLALELLQRLRDKGLTAEQLASAKAYVKGIFPTERLETADQVATVLGDLELFGLNRGEVDDLFARIDAVTLEQANQAARKYFGSSTLTFVLVGNGAKIREAAKKYAPDFQEAPITKPGFGPFNEPRP
jgi:zinc protease